MKYLSFTLILLILLNPAWLNQPLLIVLFLAWSTALLKFTKISSHTLLVLLMLEFLMLLFLVLLSYLKTSMFCNTSFLLTFFTLAVCEASLGLGLLIAISRKLGSQLLYLSFSFKLNKLSAFKADITFSKA